MTDISLPIEYFKKAAKSLHKQAGAADPIACRRARAVFTDLTDKADAAVAAAFTLMRAQHVIAVEHAFEKWEPLTHSSATQLHLAITMARVANLTDFGIGLYSEHQKLPLRERTAKFEEERELLRKSADRVQVVIDWLRRNIRPIKTINMRRSSYGLKHVAEKDTGYITNGVFIAAAISAGYPYKIYEPNPAFGMSERSINECLEKRRNSSG